MTHHQKNVNKNHSEITSHLLGCLLSEPQKNNKHCWIMEKLKPLTLLVGKENAVITMEKQYEISTKNQNYNYHVIQQLLHWVYIYPRELKLGSQREICTSVSLQNCSQ